MRWPWSCPEPSALARAMTEGMPRGVRRHADGCLRCQAAWDETRRWLSAARDVPAAEMGAAVRGRMADAIVAAALEIDAAKTRSSRSRRARSGRGRRVALGTSMLLVAAGSAAAARWAPRHPQQAAAPASIQAPAAEDVIVDGRVRPGEGAVLQWVHGGDDALVAVDDGTVEVDATARPADGLRIVTADAEVEAAGTQMVLTVVHRRLAGIRVVHGVARLRSRAGGAMMRAGDSWSRQAGVVAGEGGDGAFPERSSVSPRARGERRRTPGASRPSGTAPLHGV
jgi:hypothetical protein